jgi:hypothetical protein
MATIGTSRIALGLATFALLAGCGSTAASTTTAPGKAQASPAVSKDKGLALAYSDAVGPASSSLGTGMAASGTACSATSTIDECRASVAHTRDLAYAMQTVMNDHSAPACMGPAPHDYTAGINLLIQGTSDEVAGLDNTDAPTITKGTDEVMQSTALINKANTEISQSTC